MPNHHHRSGSLKQSNKRNKRSKASKRSLARATGGRVNAASRASSSNLVARSKADRRHTLKQKRETSRQALLQKKRGIGGGGGGALPPRVIGIISLGESVQIEQRLIDVLVQGADRVVPSQTGDESTVTAKYNKHKKEGTLTYLTNSRSFCPQYGKGTDDAAVLGALDLCRVCDMVLFVLDGNETNPEANVLGMNIGGDEPSVSTNKSSGPQSWDHLISARGDKILSAVKGQGLPTPLTILAHTAKEETDEDFMTMQSAKSIRRSALKRKMDLKHYVSRFATTEFGPEKDKIVEVDLTVAEEEDGMEEDEVVDAASHARKASSDALVRTLCTMAATPPKWVADAPRSYLLSETHEYSAEKQELSITGYLRGAIPFDVNALVHVPNLGTYACCSVKKALPPMNARKGDAVVEEEGAVLFSDPSKRESLDMLAMPDALEGEQNLVGFDDAIHDGDFEESEDDGDDKAERPVGWSDYQSAWLDAVDELDENELDHGELARTLNQKTSGGASVAGGLVDMDEDNDVSAEEKRAILEQRRRDHKEYSEFPDEVEVNEDVNARDRFARYRSLKSFRKSHWDPKENLPDSYASIYHFSSFKATQRSVMADMKYRKEEASASKGQFWGKRAASEGEEQRMDDDSVEEDILDGCVPPGLYVTITLEKVTKESHDRLGSDGLVCAVSLLPHENKASVLHMALCQSTNCEQSEVPVKSKDELVFRCGWRTWKARPVFSQNNLNSDKHKFERFLPQGGAFFAASAFGPVTYTPSPVLVFREQQSGSGNSTSRELLAIGSILGADADRIVVKRIILTGYPVRVHKRYATVKYMFYNPEDVKWFKPAGLTTKHGLNGHILESVGEHGTMKCLFNAPIKQHDTVCLPLYKRIFPKFSPAIGSADDAATVGTSAAKSKLLVL